MNTRQFVEMCKAERDAMFGQYVRPDSKSEVATRLAAASLTPQQRSEVLGALDAALTDAFYTMLLGLSGSASLGSTQQSYSILDEAGAVIGESEEGDLESLAYKIFQAN